MGFLAETMKRCWDEMIGFGCIFTIFFVGFVIMFFMFLNRYLYEWSNFIVAGETTFGMLLGKLEFADIKDASIVAALMVFCYALSMALIMINIFFTIIISSFEEVKRDLMGKPDELAILEYIKLRAKMFIGAKKVIAFLVLSN
jgi:hypothetical protein